MLIVSLSRAFKAEFFNEPVLIVSFDEVCNRHAKLLDGPVGSAIDDLLFESPIEAFCHAVGLRLGYEGKARRDSPELDLVLEMVRKILRTVIHSKRESSGRIGTDRSKPARERHGNRLQRCKPVTGLGQVPAQALSVPVLHRGKEPGPAIFRREDPGAVGAPQNVRGSGDDLTIMLFGRPLEHSGRREQVMLSHDPEDPLPADLVALDEPKASIDLAMSFPDELGCRQIGSDESKKLVIGDRGLRASFRSEERRVGK